MIGVLYHGRKVCQGDFYFLWVWINSSAISGCFSSSLLSSARSFASVQITMPASPGELFQEGILFIKNNTDKDHTWNTTPPVRFVSEIDADTAPTPAADGYYTCYTCRWMYNIKL